MSHDLRAQADWSAGEGFLAVAPDLYSSGSRLGCLLDLGHHRAGPSMTSKQPGGGYAVALAARSRGRHDVVGVAG